MSAISSPGVVADGGPASTGVPNLTTSQRKRIRAYLKRCRINPRHSQLNLEGYLLLPVQRIPRYRLLVSSPKMFASLVLTSSHSWRNYCEARLRLMTTWKTLWSALYQKYPYLPLI